MAFTLEDGTGVAGSNAYIDRAFADEYHTDRGFTSWINDGVNPITDAQKEAAIIRASDHIDRVYGTFFRGWRTARTQGMQWPRTGAWDPDGFELTGIPIQLQHACAEYALRALLQGVLTPDPPPLSPPQNFESGQTTSQTGQGTGAVAKTRERVGPIECEVSYQNTSSSSSGYKSSQLENYPAADMMLRPLLESRNSELIRG